MNQLIRDVAAAIIVLGGLGVAVLEIKLWLACDKTYRWLFFFKSFAGLCCSLLFSMSLLRLFRGGSDIIDPLLGRPVFIIILTALALGAVYNNKIRGAC